MYSKYLKEENITDLFMRATDMSGIETSTQGIKDLVKKLRNNMDADELKRLVNKVKEDKNLTSAAIRSLQQQQQIDNVSSARRAGTSAWEKLLNQTSDKNVSKMKIRQAMLRGDTGNENRRLLPRRFSGTGAVDEAKKLAPRSIDVPRHPPGSNMFSRGINRTIYYWGPKGEGGQAIGKSLGTAGEYYSRPFRKAGRWIGNKYDQTGELIRNNTGKIAIGTGAAGAVIGAKAAMAANDADKSKARKERERYDY